MNISLISKRIQGGCLFIIVSAALFYSAAVEAFTSLPGAPDLSPELQQKLVAQLTKKTAEYQPRTQHLSSNNQAKYLNRLILEPSPYLQQHAHNPVNWFPWSKEAFLEAKRLNRPIFLSIGYATCHWCHVMERESFDDEVTARFLNEHFIAIKVDRESRPDIDEIYMTAVRAMEIEAGWPLNVWLTPDKQPFYGGSYFPAKNSYGNPSFLSVLKAIEAQYQQDPHSVAEYAASLTRDVREYLQGVSQEDSEKRMTTKILMQRSHAYYLKQFDKRWGGVDRFTKFPSSFPNRMLMRYNQQVGGELAMVELTLNQMASGGIYDQLGGGFHRYSTDKKWRVPHYEKMLYDNALLAITYIEAWQLTKSPRYKQVATKTLDFLIEEMLSPVGGFYSAIDADSLSTKEEMTEGAFYTWSLAEIESILNDAQVKLAKQHFNLPVEQRLKRSVLYIDSNLTAMQSEEQAAQPLSSSETHAIAQMKAKLYQARQMRTPPLLDNKILVSWNGLVISALAKGAFVYGRQAYLNAAVNAAAFIENNLIIDGRIRHLYHDSAISETGFLEDYTHLIAGLIDLYQAGSDPHWLSLAMTLQQVQQDHYADKNLGGYFRVADDAELVISRLKLAEDTPLPSGNAVAIHNLLRLYLFTMDSRYLESATLSLKWLSPLLEQAPERYNEVLLALSYLEKDSKEVILVHPSEGKTNSALEQVIRETFLPNSIVTIIKQSDIETNQEVSPLVAGKLALNNRSTAYVCYLGLCKLPTQDVQVLQRQLTEIRMAE